MSFLKPCLLLLMVLACTTDALEKGHSFSGFHENASYSPLIDLLNSAVRSIDIEIYDMDDPKVLEALVLAQARGVRLHIVQEPTPMGGKCHVFKAVREREDDNCRFRKNLVFEVRANGGIYAPFNKDLCGVEGKSCFQHGKMVIIDGHTAMLSTGNFNSTNLCNVEAGPEICNRDYSYVTEDQEVVDTLENIFEHDLYGEPYDLSSLLSPGVSERLTVSPIGLGRIIDFIASAKFRIQIQNQYLREPTVNEALIVAAQKGVDVQVTVASLCHFERPKPTAAQRANQIYSAFADAGITTRFFTREILVGGMPGYLHTKAIVVDNARAWVGSMNGSNEAATMNREYGIIFDSPHDVRKLSQLMDADHFNEGTESLHESLACLKDGR